RTKLTALQVQLPPNYQFEEKIGVQPSAVLQGPPVIDSLTHIAHIPLSYTKPGPFKLTLEGIYTPATAGSPSTVFLPKLKGTLDRGTIVTIQLPESHKWVNNSTNKAEAEVISQ